MIKKEKLRGIFQTLWAHTHTHTQTLTLISAGGRRNASQGHGSSPSCRQPPGMQSSKASVSFAGSLFTVSLPFLALFFF